MAGWHHRKLEFRQATSSLKDINLCQVCSISLHVYPPPSPLPSTPFETTLHIQSTHHIFLFPFIFVFHLFSFQISHPLPILLHSKLSRLPATSNTNYFFLNLIFLPSVMCSSHSFTCLRHNQPTPSLLLESGDFSSMRSFRAKLRESLYRNCGMPILRGKKLARVILKMVQHRDSRGGSRHFNWSTNKTLQTRSWEIISIYVAQTGKKLIRRKI